MGAGIEMTDHGETRLKGVEVVDGEFMCGDTDDHRFDPAIGKAQSRAEKCSSAAC